MTGCAAGERTTWLVVIAEHDDIKPTRLLYSEGIADNKMHLVFVEQHGLEETQIAIDLDQSSAELVVLSFQIAI